VDVTVERREHPRIRLRLPLDCVLESPPPDSAGELRAGPAASRVHHGVTVDLSPRGVYFETDSDAFERGMRVRFDLTVPPGEGHSPYPGRVRGQGEVLRVVASPLVGGAAGDVDRSRRFGVAARFSEPVEFLF
jgi:hypothetical protein